jgi:hypothetical protein
LSTDAHWVGSHTGGTLIGSDRTDHILNNKRGVEERGQQGREGLGGFYYMRRIEAFLQTKLEINIMDSDWSGKWN